VLFGLNVRELDRHLVRRLELPLDLQGVYVSSVDALSGAAEAGFAHGDIILEINRKPVTSMREYLRLLDGAAEGMVYAFLCYVPELDQRVLRTLRVEMTRS